MKGILISLVVCVSFLFASNPVEPAKRTLFVYQHGLGNDSRGAVAKNCRMDAGSANATFDATGNHSFLIQEIANSWHHVYNQVLQHPGISPEVLKYEFGAIGYDAEHPKLQNSYAGKCSMVEDAPVPAATDSLISLPRYSTLENAQYYWFANELAAYLRFDDANELWVSPKYLLGRDVADSVGRGRSILLSEPLAYNDMRLYQWFKDKGVDNQLAILPPQDSIFALLSLLRKERPDLIPSRYTILAHSMGGLTAREYIQSDFYQGDVDKLITFDTPHLGSGSAAAARYFIHNDYINEKSFGLALNIAAFAAMKGEHDVLRFSLMVSAVMEDFLGGFYQKALSLNENLTQGYTDKDDALLYMGKYPDYSDELRDLNDRGMGAGGFPIPELRLFGVDGVTTLGNPRNRVCEWKYSGDMANMFSGFVPGANLLEQVCGMGMHVFGDYDDGVSNTQIFGNGALAGGGTIAGLNLNEHGSLVVPLKSSTAAGVELYRKGNAKKKVYAIESEDIGQIGGWVIGGTASAIATYALLRTIGGFTHTSASLLAGAAGAAVAAAGTLISSDDIGLVLETSHDYATKHSWKKNSRKIDGTDLEEFLYEKPFLSIAALKDNEGRLYPKIFTDTVPGSMNRLAPREVMGLSDWCDIAFEMGDAAINVAFCRQDPIGEWSRHWMGTVETAAPIDFGRSYPSALALKSEQYDPVRCVDEGACTARYGEPSQGTRPKVRRSSYYDYSATMLTETPEEIHLVVDDLRPDLLRSVSLDFNFSHQFVWKLDEDRNSCSLAYHGTWTEADTVLERGQCPVDAYGNWVLRPGELARKVNADFGAKDLIRDGQNTLSFSLTNKVGLAHSQRVYMLRQAVPPRLDLMWPRMGAVLSERCPEFSTLLDLVQYPGLSDGDARWRILKDEVDAQQEWALFGRPDTLLRSVGGKAESLYLFRGSCGQEPLPEGAYLYAAEIGSTAATGQQGKSFTLSTPFKIDVSAPEIALAVAPSAMMPPFVDTDKDSLIADLEWSDAANLRAAVFEVVSSDGHRVHSEVALWPAGPVALRWNGKGCSGGLCPDGEYKIVVRAFDEAVRDSAQYHDLLVLEENGAADRWIAWFDSNATRLNGKTDSGRIRLVRSSPKIEALDALEIGEGTHLDDGVLNSDERLGARVRLKQRSAVDSLPVSGTLSLSAENQEERVVYFSGYLRGEGRERSLDTTLSLETQELGLPSGKWIAVLRISDALGHADSLALSDTIVIDRKPPVVSDPFPGALVYRVNDTGTMTMSFLTDGTEAFCTAAWRGPDGQTLASGNASREGGKYVSTLRGHDRSRNVGQWSVDIECPDDAGNIGHATGSLLLGVRPPRIVSPEDAISGTVAVRGTIGNVNGNAAQASGDVRWKLHWRHKGESGWRSEGLRVASMYHAFGDSLNMGHGAVVNAQTIALWDASVVSGEEIEAVVLRLAAESCAKDSCMGAVDTVDLYHTGDVDEAVSFRVSGLGASKTINAGDSLRLVGIVSGHRPDDAYELKWSLRDAEGMVLADETVLTPVGNWQGVPSLSGMRARGLRGVALGVENGEWFISANEPIQGLKLPVTSMEKNFSGAGGLFANAMPIMGGDSVLAEKLNVTIGLKSKSIASCDSLKKVTGVTCNILEMTPDSTSADAVRWNMVIGIPAGANIDKVSLGRGISGEMTMMASAMPASSDTNTVKTASMLFGAEKVYAGDSLSHAPHPAYGWPIVLAEAVPFDWDGFSQVGKRYPHGGWARLSVLAVSRNTGAAYLYEDSLYIHAGSPRIVGLKTTPDALYHSSNGAGLDLGRISFSFGLAGSDARYRVFVAQGDKMVKDFGERRYNAAADSSAYRMDWDGLRQDASLATAGTYALAFERLDENGNPIDTLRSAPFEVKMTAWTDYASRKDLPGVTPRFRIRESAMNGEDAYVGATGDYLLAGTLSAKQLKGDSLDCTVDFKGTQTIYDYPAQRYTVGIRQRRDRFQLDVYVAVIGEGWGELKLDWFSFSWENNDGHRQYYVIKKKRLTISRDLDDTITVQGHWEDNGIGYDGYKNSDTRDTRLVVIAVDPDNPGDEKTRKALKEISDNMNSNGVWKFTRTKKQQMNNEHHADVAEFLTDSASGVFSWNKLAGFRDTVAEYSATAPACGSFREDSGYKSCAGDVFNGNKNLFRISARPVAGEKHWTYGNLEKMTSNNNGAHEDVGASFRLKVPREYFDANWGVQNYANSMARMDGFNSDKAGMVPMLVNPLHSVTWPLADEENQLAFDGSDSAKLPDDNLRTEFRFFGGYGDPSLYQSLAVSGDAPCGTVTNANSGSSGNGGFDVLVCRGPVKTMEATVSLKAKKSGLRRVSIPYPATGYSWKHDKANELCDEESAANGELKSCYYRDSLASGIHYYSVGSGERLPEAFSLPIDVKTGFVSDSIARLARASGLDASRIGKAQCALKIPIDRYDAVAGTVGALAAGVNSPANGENGCAVFTTHDNGNGVSIESASLKVAATSTANDWKCNGYSCESFPLTDDGLMLSRAAADSDLVDWDPKADPAFEDNRLAKEFPVSSRKGASRNVFVRRSDLLGANHDAPVNLGHEVFSWKDAYVKGRDTKAPDSSGAVMWLADRTYKARPDLIGLRMDSAIVYDVAGFRHGVFLGSLSGKDSVKVSRAGGGAASAPEWVTVLMNGKWEGDELTLMCMQDSGVRVVDGAIWKQADSGATATVNDTTYNVLGYIDVKRLTGSTSFFLVSHKGEESYYRKLDVHVGSLVRPGTETIVRSVYGDASVKLPAGSYESEVAGTVRLVSPGESRLVAEEGLPVVGPVIEVLPSRRFCTAESCSFENMPQVNVTISRAQFESSQLNGVAEKDPSALRLYKVADESIVPLEHTVLAFMTMDGTACDPVDTPCREWKWLRVSGSTGSFSTFALMDSALAVGHDVDFVVEPEESASPERRIRFDGLGIGGVEFYWDDDTLFTEANDATPPIAALGYDGNLPLDTVLRLPNAAYRQYLHAVPILMDGALSPSRAVWREVRLPGELKFAYVGADTVWFGNVNGRLTVPCSTTSDVALLARFNDRFGETWLEESDTVRAPGSDMDFLAPLLLRQPSYRLVLAATDVLGANLQILGPLVKVDGDLPAASLKASLVYGSKAKVADWTLVSSDSTSGVAKAEWSISLGGREVLSGAVDAPADTLTRADTIPISELERCPGCELRMTARILDRGGNMTTRSVTWKSVYPFPNSLVAWYPMTEGVGGRLIDHGPSGMDLTFNRADGIWPNGVSLELSHNGLATTAAWTNLAGNDTSWAIEGWYRGMSGMTIRPLWSWGMWNAYRLDDDLIFVSGEATHRFAKVFADNGVAIHLALNYADGRMEVWRDGRLMSAQSLAGPVELAGKAALNLGDGHRTVGASLRDWRFYGHALTASQISELASRRGWAAEDPCIVGIASNVHAYIKDQSAAGSQYANLRLKIVADDGVDLGKNAVIRYYFSEERLAPYAEIWDPWSAPIAGHSDDSGSHWFDFDLRGFARLDGTMGENGRGISVAFRDENDWGRHWNLSDDPSWLESSGDFVPAPRVEVYDTLGNLLSGPSCIEPEENPAAREVHVIAKDASGDMTRGTQLQYYVENVGRTPLVDPVVRYYMTLPEGAPLSVSVWNLANADTQTVDLGGGHRILEIHYKHTLNPGEKSDWNGFASLMLRHNDSWPYIAWDASDDWSHEAMDGRPQANAHITVHDADGRLVWGELPQWGARRFAPDSSEARFENGALEITIDDPGELRVRYVDVLGQDRGLVYLGYLDAGRHVIPLTSRQWSERLLYRTVIELDGKTIWNFSQQE